MDLWVVAIDIGGTQLRTAKVSADGEIATEVRRLTPVAEGPDAIIGALVESVEQVLSPGDKASISAIGIAAPGPVLTGSGILIDPPNLHGWGRRSLSKPFEEAFGLPAYVGNDANLGALGERRFGAGRGVDDLLYLTVSTGVGGGVISGGRLITGWHGFAAEGGHQVIQPEGPLCGCGRRGHLEALASGLAISRNARERLEAGDPSLLRSMVESPGLITAETVAKAASQGDPLSIRNFQEAGYYLGFIGKWGVGQPPEGLFDYNKGWPGQNQYYQKVRGEDPFEYLTPGAGQDGQPAFHQFPYDAHLHSMYRDVLIPPAPLSEPAFFEALPELLKTSENRVRWQVRFATPEMYQESVKAYYRLISGVDIVVGRIVQKLDELGRDANTITL